MPPSSPAWKVENEGSFASVCVGLPPGTRIHCESDAVVTMSQSVDVRGVISGGILAGLARAFLTRESFFTTRVENASREAPGDVLIAPSDPGGIALHRLFRNDEMMLTSGAYLAADESVHVESAMQGQLGNSLLSGTGFFLLRASGEGNLAIAAYGSMHKYILAAGEKRMVDNGHLVAWTSSMKYRMKLASARAGFLGSVTSGEGLHCEFAGPGVIYIQSHKPSMSGEGNSSGSSRPKSGGSGGGGGPIGACIGMMIFLIVLGIVLAASSGLLDGFEFETGPSSSPTRRYRKYNTYEYGGGGQHQRQQQQYQQQRRHHQQQQRQHGGGYNNNNGGGNNEYYEGEL
mmetsp:Transcript_14441/g.24072  ORF Transcript_14441/g.24072 Transcript_14441/m.24072 type:complete len:345 (-) Transcript_14441:615-1649(-)